MRQTNDTDRCADDDLREKDTNEPWPHEHFLDYWSLGFAPPGARRLALSLSSVQVLLSDRYLNTIEDQITSRRRFVVTSVHTISIHIYPYYCFLEAMGKYFASLGTTCFAYKSVIVSWLHCLLKMDGSTTTTDKSWMMMIVKRCVLPIVVFIFRYQFVVIAVLWRFQNHFAILSGRVSIAGKMDIQVPIYGWSYSYGNERAIALYLHDCMSIR